MNRGQDSEMYLKQGYNVVALEGNPALTTRNSARLQKYIDQGKLTVLNNAVDKTDDKSLTFYVPVLKPGAHSILTFLEKVDALKDEFTTIDQDGKKISKAKQID